jgi:photosystem II stability/assembly factor-like uncharacterized protein
MRFGLTLTIALLLFSAAWYCVSPQKQSAWPARSYPNFRVEFFDNQTGVIVGPRVFHTNNGGQAWSIIDYVNPSDSYKAKDNPRYARHLVDFVDAEWAWRLSPKDSNSVEYSTDGARTWSEPIRTGTGYRSSLAFVTREFGWVFGDVPSVTHDGGRTWREERSLADFKFEESYFLDQNHGWVANYWGAIARTTDGGEHWNVVRTELKNIRSLFFLSADEGWAVGDNGLIAKTENGGTDWEITNASVQSELLDVYFLSPTNGWIVGQDGLILLTKDGGKSWTHGLSTVRAPLCSVRFTDPLHGWAVGGNPTPAVPVSSPSNVVLETIDGGENWKEKVF